MDEQQEERIVNVADGSEGEPAFVQEEQMTNYVQNGLRSEPTFAQGEKHIVNVEDGLGDDPAFVQEEEITDNGADDLGSKSSYAFIDNLDYSPCFLEDQVIYPVPLCLKNDNTVSFYHPKEISFGPRHFGFCPRHFGFCPQHFKNEVGYTGLELFKLEVAGEFHERLRKKGDSLISLVEMLDSEKKREIEKSYDRPYKTEISLAWLLVRDGCFVLQVLDRFAEQDTPETENGRKTVLQHILNRKNHHPLLNDIVKDMFKLENQLPLLVLKEIKMRLEGKLEKYWFEHALKILSPVEVREEIGCRKYRRQIHLLQLLGEYMVDIGNEKPRQEKAIVVEGSHINLGKYIITVLMVIFFVLLCLSLSPVFIIWFLWLVVSLMWESYQNYKWGEADKDDRHVPTIEELYRIGVKLKKLKHEGISHIRFDENQSTLYLPKFTVDDSSEVILKNLLVLETHWDDPQKIITRYVVLMNDLVNTSGDVSRLRQEGIISNKLGSDEDVARLWNSVTIPATDIPSYEPIDTAASSINAYRRKGLKILWAQFRRVHCSKPWLVASLLGGISLLFFTVVQVVCLFEKCQKV